MKSPAVGLPVVGLLLITLVESLGPSTPPASKGLARPEGDGAAKVFVCQNRWCKQRGSDATLQALAGLVPLQQTELYSVECLGACERGPNLRLKPPGDSPVFEVHNVDSVARVVEVLADVLDVTVDPRAAECLHLNLLANGQLEQGKIDEAISTYGDALRVGHSEQRGILLDLRSAAFLERALGFRAKLEAAGQSGLAMSADGPNSVLEREVASCALLLASTCQRSPLVCHLHLLGCTLHRCREYQKHQFHFRLYRTALLEALRDAQHATELIPKFPRPFQRAARILVLLSRFDEAADVYALVAELKPNQATALEAAAANLRTAAAELAQCRAQGVSDLDAIPRLRSLLQDGPF